MRPHGREASSHDVEVTTSQIRTRGQIRRWRQYLADERSEAAGYRRLAARRTGEEREILLALADAEMRHESHWLEVLGNNVGQPRSSSVGTPQYLTVNALVGRHLIGGVWVGVIW